MSFTKHKRKQPQLQISVSSEEVTTLPRLSTKQVFLEMSHVAEDMQRSSHRRICKTWLTGMESCFDIFETLSSQPSSDSVSMLLQDESGQLQYMKLSNRRIIVLKLGPAEEELTTLGPQRLGVVLEQWTKSWTGVTFEARTLKRTSQIFFQLKCSYRCIHMELRSSTCVCARTSHVFCAVMVMGIPRSPMLSAPDNC